MIIIQQAPHFEAAVFQQTMLSLLLVALLLSLSSIAPETAAFAPATTSTFFGVHKKQHYKNIESVVATTSTSSSRLAMSSSTGTKAEIEVVKNPSKEFLDQKGVFNWGTWGCGVSNFPWTYDQTESCYLLAGQVTVTPTDGRKPATFGKGDFVTFPAGMSCTWDVTEAVQKHFMFY